MSGHRFDRGTIPIDQQLAVRTAAARLRGGASTARFGAGTIERFLVHSFDEFAARATVMNWLPLLVERFARQWLSAQAKVEGKSDDDRLVVLFLCVSNAGRSQMALGFFQHLAADTAIGWSGGSEPGTHVNPAAIEAMAERGIHISAEYLKPWTDEVVRAAHAVITMGCDDACPIFPGKLYEDWDRFGIQRGGAWVLGWAHAAAPADCAGCGAWVCCRG